jgi:voltage-gated potassium channel
MGRLEHRITVVLAILRGILASGTLGYMLVEGWSPLDALYMTVITLATVGYGETHPLSPVGRIYTIALILIGLGVVGYGLSTVVAFLVEGQLTGILERRKMERKIRSLRDHVILVGAGETGKHIAEELLNTGTPFVVIERDPAQVGALERLGKVLYINGDATESGVLREARIESARGLISSAPSDKDNLFVILTARELNSALRIVSRVIAEGSRHKLLKAGADAVVSSNLIGGLRMASEMLRPHVVSFLRRHAPRDRGIHGARRGGPDPSDIWVAPSRRCRSARRSASWCSASGKRPPAGIFSIRSRPSVSVSGTSSSGASIGTSSPPFAASSPAASPRPEGPPLPTGTGNRPGTLGGQGAAPRRVA